jgi:hypothetical protein
MMISSGYDQCQGNIDSAKNFLNGLTEVVAAYDLEQQIADQEDVLKKATKKYRT